jgi:hypothetical protein
MSHPDDPALKEVTDIISRLEAAATAATAAVEAADASDNTGQASGPLDISAARVVEILRTQAAEAREWLEAVKRAAATAEKEMHQLYQTDTALWAERQAAALRRRCITELDWKNVAEEIEDVARSDRREIHNWLAVICTHLLKWAYQPRRRSPSWRRSIVEGRSQIVNLVEESPSLEPYPASRLVKAYADGHRIAVAETSLADLPETCPWTIDQVLDHKFWPPPD